MLYGGAECVSSKSDVRRAWNCMERGLDRKVVEKNEGFTRCLVFAK